MAEYIHSVLAQYEAVAVGTVITYDLPVNPLSHIFITLAYQQNSANASTDIDNIIAMISKVEVLYKGSAIWSSSGYDLFAVSAFLTGFEGWTQNRYGLDNEYGAITYMLPLGRVPFDPRECFPRSTRGELVLQITYAAAFTLIDNVRALIETVELPDASPSRYLRVTTLSVTPAAAGEMDVELPIGNPISEVIFWGTTKPLADANVQTLQYGQLLVDNQRRYISHCNYEIWRNLAACRTRPLIAHGHHYHQFDAAAYAQWDFTDEALYRNNMLCQYALWEFDPLRDSQYLLQTAGRSDVVARIYAGDTNALRVIPCELIGV